MVLVCLLCAACALAASPAAAQTEAKGWLLSAEIGPAFGTLGTTPNVDVQTGYRVNETVRIVGEFGGLSHAPFEKAASIAPSVPAPEAFTDSRVHVNGYHYNANAIVTPKAWGRVFPYVTGGLGAFTGSTVARYNVGGPTWPKRYQSATNFAANLGGGVSYRINRWLGVNGDYRNFIVDTPAANHYVNRFAAGVSLFVE
jgi:opacity protein-like surface antigen